VTPGRIWLASLAFLTLAYAAVYALANPVAFVVIVAGVTWLAGVVGGITAATRWMEERAARADADARAEVLEGELGAAYETLNALLDEHALCPTPLRPVTPIERPDLRVIGPQSTGEHDHLAADDDWFARLYDENGNPR
jgi:hypothetical protein